MVIPHVVLSYIPSGGSEGAVQSYAYHSSPIVAMGTRGQLQSEFPDRKVAVLQKSGILI